MPYTEKKDKHILCGYSITTCYSHGKSLNKTKYYRGLDCVETFSQDLKKCYILMKNSVIYVKKSFVQIKKVRTTKINVKLETIVILLVTIVVLLIVYVF